MDTAAISYVLYIFFVYPALMCILMWVKWQEMEGYLNTSPTWGQFLKHFFFIDGVKFAVYFLTYMFIFDIILLCNL